MAKVKSRPQMHGLWRAAAKAAVVRKSLGGNPVPVRFRPQADSAAAAAVVTVRGSTEMSTVTPAADTCTCSAKLMSLRDYRALSRAAAAGTPIVTQRASPG